MNGAYISAVFLALVGVGVFATAGGAHRRSFRWIGAIMVLVGAGLFTAASVDSTARLLERLF